MKKQLLLTILLSSQTLPAFQKEFFSAVRDIIDAAEEQWNHQRTFLYPNRQTSTVTLSADEHGATARVTNAPYDQTASTRADKHMLVLKHPAFTAAFKESIIRRRNDNVYQLAARINTNQIEQTQDEQHALNTSYSSLVEKNIILSKPIDTSKATITYLVPAETQTTDAQDATKKLGEYVFYFPYKEIVEQQVPITVKVQEQAAQRP